MMAETSKRRIAVLGGGMSTMVTLLKLTELDNWKERFEFDVYQMGWRLGGKGASGRLQGDLEGGGSSDRIVEHGLHVLFGFYENTFRVLRRVIKEARELDWIWDFDDAFKAHDLLVMFERIDEEWLPWPENLPVRPGAPGVPGAGGLADEPADFYFRGILELLVRTHQLTAAVFAAEFEGRSSETLVTVDRAMVEIRDVSTAPELQLDAVRRSLLELRSKTERGLEADDLFRNSSVRRTLLKLHLFAVIGLGYLAEFGLRAPDWFKLDDYDYRDWLARYGAHRKLIESPLVVGLYDGAYSADERYGAGTCLHCLLESLLHQKGSAMYKMQAGMGDVIFAPIYKVLEKRGVRFHFFHRVEALHLDPDRTVVDSIEIDVQADLRGARRTCEYRPLLERQGKIWAWPAAPLFEQLQDDQEVRKHNLENSWDAYRRRPLSLHRTVDYDDVLLGISVGAFPDICRELMADPDNSDFAAMVHGIRTTLTQSAQIWFNKDAAKLGWGHELAICIPFARPFDTWADMSHLAAQEKVAETKFLAYLTSSLPDPPDDPAPPRDAPPSAEGRDYPERLRALVRENVRAWLSESAHMPWPELVDNGRVKWDWLVASSNRADPLMDQWVIAADNPSDRYNLAVPGSNRRRLRPAESGYANLTLCGDWTLNSLSVGCLESATMSGIEAARVLSGGAVDLPVNHWLPDSYRRRTPGKRFVHRDGAMLAPPPVGLDVRLYVFEIPASFERLQALCDRELNLPGSPYTYRPATHSRTRVMFYASELVNLVPGGAVPERDFGFWVPLRRTGGDREEEAVVYSPYLWVDSSPALVNGATVFGFPKQFGDMVMPRGPAAPLEFSVSAWYQPSAGAMVEKGPMLKVMPVDRFEVLESVADWESARRAMVAQVGGDAEWQDYFQLIEEAGMKQVFLKQFMTADGVFGAAHQEILEAPIPVQMLREFKRIRGEWKLTLRHVASHSIVRTLGLTGARYGREPFPHWALDLKGCNFASFMSTVGPAESLFS